MEKTKDKTDLKSYCTAIGDMIYKLHKDGFFGEVIVKVHHPPFQVVANCSAKTEKQLEKIPEHLKYIKSFSDNPHQHNNNS